MKKAKAFLSIIMTLILFLTGCTPILNNTPNTEKEPKELTIYSGRQEKFIIPLVEKFQEQTGIKVNLVSGKATEYAHRIIEENENTQADVFLSNDGGILEYLRVANMLTPINSEVLKNVPLKYQGKDQLWTALTIRCRVFMYNKDLISYEEMPKSIFDLVDPKYKGQFTMNRAGNESMITYFAAINSVIGREKTLELIKGIMANNPLVLQSSTDVRRAVGSGEVKFGSVNNYHYKVQLLEKGMNNVGVIFPDQGINEVGTFANVSGAAIIKYAKHPNNALQFIEFLLQPEQQKMNDETPILSNLEGIEYDQYRDADVPFNKIGELWQETIDLMEQAGYSD